MGTESGEGILIRTASEDDLPRILEICREAFGIEADSESELLAFLRKCPDGCLVAQIGDEIAAFSIAFVRDGRPHIYGTAVASEFRSRRGIGTELAMRQLADFQRLGYSEVDTYIRCTNTIAFKTAQKLGFKHVRTVRNFYILAQGQRPLHDEILIRRWESLSLRP